MGSHIVFDLSIPWFGDYFTADDEIEEIEVGERVGNWFTNFMPVYTSIDSRVQSTVTALVAGIAERARDVGAAFPMEWWPPSATKPEPGRVR